MTSHIACTNDECAFQGLPFLAGGDNVECAECGKPMSAVEVDTSPPEPEPVYQPEGDALRDQERGLARAEILSRLAATDLWVLRAYEDGEPLSDERRRYRAALRETLAKVEAAAAPARVKIPAPPSG